MLETFWRAGVGVVCDETSRLLKMAKESDYVSISPIPNKYCCDDEVGNEMSLALSMRHYFCSTSGRCYSCHKMGKATKSKTTRLWSKRKMIPKNEISTFQ